MTKKQIKKKCEGKSQSEVYDIANENTDKVIWEHCEGCDCPSPTFKREHTCLVCGQETELLPARQVTVEVTVHLTLTLDENETVDKVLQEMDYHFSYNPDAQQQRIESSELIDSEVLDVYDEEE